MERGTSAAGPGTYLNWHADNRDKRATAPTREAGKTDESGGKRWTGEMAADAGEERRASRMEESPGEERQ